MRIPCPYCGDRDHHEFVYQGASVGLRPETAEEMFAHTYIRANPAGEHRELWYHAGGCRSWLEVERNTRTHAVIFARLMRTEAAR